MFKKLIVVAASAAVFSTPAYAAPGNSATATGSATATVVAPITLTHDTNAVLAFGTFAVGTVGGSVTVDTSGNGNVGGTDVVFVSGSTNSADSFTVGGDANRAFTISTAGGTVSSGANSMSFITTDSGSGSGTLDGSGSATFTVGGTLTVSANQAPGAYTGTYNATVTYN